MKTTIKVKDLKFGVNVFRMDQVRMYPTACGQQMIFKDSDLDYIRDTYGELDMVIDRDAPRYGIFTVPSWTEGIKRRDQSKVNILNKWASETSRTPYQSAQELN